MRTKLLPVLLLALPLVSHARFQSNLAQNANLMAAANQQGQAQSQNQQNSNLINSNHFQTGSTGNVISTKMPQKDFWQKLRDDTSFTYYQQFLGPTAKGDRSETYNVFQASGTGNEKNSGRAPLQSFHAVNLRHQINSNWALGTSLAVSKGYTGDVTNTNGDVNTPDDQFFNARVYLNLPAARFDSGTLFSTVSYEAPSSVISREQDMTWGWVLAETFALKLPGYKWTAGVTGQAYRMYYEENTRVTPYVFPDGSFGIPMITEMQTLILSGGPYLNYQFSESWLIGSAIVLDWDQRGEQTGTTKLNNNLPHRGRLSATYFPTSPMLKNLASVGVFTQALLKYRPETMAFGAEFMLRF
jgi:hypothetical protein